jgi:hypothetical protein
MKLDAGVVMLSVIILIVVVVNVAAPHPHLVHRVKEASQHFQCCPLLPQTANLSFEVLRRFYV